MEFKLVNQHVGVIKKSEDDVDSAPDICLCEIIGEPLTLEWRGGVAVGTTLLIPRTKLLKWSKQKTNHYFAEVSDIIAIVKNLE